MAGNVPLASFSAMTAPRFRAARTRARPRVGVDRLFTGAGMAGAARAPARRRPVHVIGTFAFLSILFASVMTPVVWARGSEMPRVVPLVLASEGPGGREYWRKTGVLDMLSKNGWCEGQDLWIFQPGGAFGDLPDVSSEFAAFVRETVRAEGIGEIQVVASGVAGLYVRYCVEEGLLDPVRVKTLVTVASPHRGAFFAGVIKSVLAMIRYEQEVSKDTRLLDVIAGKAPPVEEFGLDVILADTPWESESQFVLERARYYERLYHEYLMERHFAVPGLPLESSQETFPGWVSRRYPQIWEAKIAGGTLCERGAPRDPAPPTAPTGLTLAYYELLAMEAAKNGYAMKIVPRKSLLESITGDSHIPTSWRDALVHYGLKILAFAAKNLVILGKGAAEERVLAWGVQRLGFLDGPDDPFLGRLVTETVVVNMGRSGRNRFFVLPANAYLAAWNRSSVSSRKGTRYISMVERRPDITRLVWPQMGPSDWFVEVDAAVAPAGPDDVVMVFNTLGSLPGRGLLGNKLAREALLKTLKDPSSVCSLVRPRLGGTARVEVSSWRPSVVSIPEVTGGGGGEYEIRVSFGSVPAGWRLVAVPAANSPDVLLATDPEDPAEGRIWGAVSAPRSQTDARMGGLVSPSSAVPAHEGGNGSTSRTTPGAGVIGFRMRARSDNSEKSPVEAGVVLKLVPEDRSLAGPMSLVPERYTREVSMNVLVEVKPQEELAGTEWPESAAGPDSGSIRGEGEPTQGKWEPTRGKGEPAVVGGSELPDRTATHESRTEESKEKAVLPGGTGSSEGSRGTPHDAVGVGLPDDELADNQSRGEDRMAGSPGEEEVELPAESREQEVAEGNPAELAGWGPLIVVTYRSKKTAHWAPEENYRVPFSLELLGPKKWVTGKPAKFEASFRVDTPPGVTLESVSFDPAPKFAVIWKRAGDFKVGVAVKAKFRVTLGAEEVRVTNVYYTEVPVSVLTLGITE
ncbi:MAG: hypothetical protein IMW97_05625 [Firmicutes bacterium]|nr:hypothetical protein [Candidatus Fermentithermobacillaceae bacterium]